MRSIFFISRCLDGPCNAVAVWNVSLWEGKWRSNMLVTWQHRGRNKASPCRLNLPYIALSNCRCLHKWRHPFEARSQPRAEFTFCHSNNDVIIAVPLSPSHPSSFLCDCLLYLPSLLPSTPSHFPMLSCFIGYFGVAPGLYNSGSISIRLFHICEYHSSLSW